MEQGRMQLIFERQALHFGCLALLLMATAAAAQADGVLDGELWGFQTRYWYTVALSVPILHQVFIWLCWRTELHFSLLSRALGRGAFPFYSTVFAVLIFLKPVTVTLLATANAGSAGIAEPLRWGLAITLAVAGVYLLDSVVRHFGLARSIGSDHFDPEGHRDLPFVNKGIYRFTRHGMYHFGHCFVWVPALVGDSIAALVVALFSHVYIWVHYHSLEKPDVARIYGPPAAQPAFTQ